MLFRSLHDLLEVILRALARGRLLLVVGLEENIVVAGHVILTTSTLFYRLGEANVRRRLGEFESIQLIIVDIFSFLSWRCWHYLLGLLFRATPKGSGQSLLEMVFL